MSDAPETLFEHAQRERDRALAAVEANAPEEWKDRAFVFVEGYLREHGEMHVDDLWAAGLAEPPESRALGAVFQRAVRAGLMRKTGRSRPSVRSHLSDKPVWQSLICSQERRAS